MTANDFNRTITDLDHVRIFNMLRRQSADAAAAAQAEELSDLIDAAEVVRPQEIAGDIVTCIPSCAWPTRRAVPSAA